MADIYKTIEEAEKRYEEYRKKGDSFGMEIENNNITEARKAAQTPIMQIPKVSNAPTPNLMSAENRFTQAQSATQPPLPVAEEPKPGLMWKENAPQVSAPTPAPAQQTNATDWQSVYSNIKSMLPTYTPVKTLTWDEAMDRAKAQLNPVYDERMTTAGKNVEYNNLKSGFYGQLPGEVLKRETQIQENNARSTALASLANQLMGKSESDALQAEQNFMQKQSQDLSMIMNAMGIAQDQDNTKYNRSQDAINNKRLIANDAFDKAVTESNITGLYNKFADVEIDNEAYKYEDNLQGEINRREATPDKSDDYLIPSLQAVRFNKVTSNPNSKYKSDYMTEAQKAQIAQNELKAAQNAWEQNPDNPENIIKLNNALKAAEEAKQSSFTTKNQSEMYGLDKAAKQLGLEATKADIARTNALTANTYASTAKSKAAAKNSDPFAGATKDQVWWYNQTMDKFLNPAKGMDEYINNPKKAYQKIAGDPQGFKQLMGEKLYNALLKQAGTTASKVGITKVDNSANIAAETAALDKLYPEEAYSKLLNNPSDYINEIGTTEYNRLLGIYEKKMSK